MPLNVLLAGGAEASTVHAFAKAAQDIAGGGDVFMTHGPFRRAHEVDDARAMARRHDIGLIVPTIDDDLPLWAALAPAFAADGTDVAISSVSTVSLCHDRHLLCRSMALMGIPAASTWLPNQLTADLPLPLVVVPRNPRTGIEPVIVTSRATLDHELALRPDAVVQAHLDGPDFEVEICCDRSGHLLAVAPSEFAELAVCVASAVHITGPATIVGTLAGDRPVVRAITPRLSSRWDLSDGIGARVAAALVEMALERRNRVVFGGVSAAMGAVA